jgi:N-acetylglucosamine kinase-like BadF-type ATPase
VLIGVDAGGSRTVVQLEHGADPAHRFVLPSVNPASGGRKEAANTLAYLFSRVAAAADGEPVTGWFGSAAVTADTIEEVAATTAGAAEQAGLTGLLALTDDATMLLLAPPLGGVGVVAIVGTGAITLARNDAGDIVQCGGYEYLLADEGSGFDLGLNGLRAAARAWDGRGPATELLDRLRSVYQRPVPVLGPELAETPYPKQAVSRFARAVCESADLGDQVAIELVDQAAAAIAQAVHSARRRLARPPADVSLSGGVAVGSKSFRHKVAGRLKSVAPELKLHLVAQPARSAVELARQVQSGCGLPVAADFPCSWIRLPRP